jgi:NAD(P)-dependent dehydrogenase (short-subunit alcohol dehydrogenase family)
MIEFEEKIRLMNSAAHSPFPMDFSDLHDKRVLITAGATGIGKAIVEAFLAEGARVVVGQRDFAKLQPLLDEYSPQLHGFQVDVSRPDECEQLVADATEVLGGLDVLVNNAAVTGAPAARWFLDETREHIDTVLDTNLKGVIHCSLHAARRMKESGGGVIIHISSIGAFGAQQTASIYCASKAALTGLTQSMALELTAHSIRVVAVAPGDIRIEKSGDVAATHQSLNVDPRFVPTTPLGFGEPHDIGNLVAFLASKHAKFVTGVTWIVDGGWLCY